MKNKKISRLNEKKIKKTTLKMKNKKYHKSVNEKQKISQCT